MKDYSFHCRNILLVSALCWWAACGQPNQSDAKHADVAEQPDSVAVAPQAPQGVPETVDEIRAAHAAIMAQLEAGVLDASSFTYSCHGETNGTVSYYADQGALRMVVHAYNEHDHHSSEDTYFVLDSTLFFAYSKSLSWTFVGPEGATKDNITERRIYLIDQQPVECLEKTYAILSHAATNPNPDEVPNNEVSCNTANRVIAPYHTLLKHQHSNPRGCLEN